MAANTWEMQLESYRKQIETALDHWLPSAATRPARLHQAMRYSMQAGGKRIRPVLVLAAAELFPQRADPLPAAVAVECLHTYSLIHDDLPCMDDSDFRRGRPSCHKQFDEVTAILAGDALLTLAFLVLAEGYAQHPEIAQALVYTLSEAAGSERLIGGQVEDTLGEGQTLTAEDVEYIHRNKTAALLAACLRMGLLCTEATEAAVETGTRIGQNMGLAFQIVDDILDTTSDLQTLGKTPGQDFQNRKNTYVTIHGLERSRLMVQVLTSESRKLCRELSPHTWFLSELIGHLEHRIK